MARKLTQMDRSSSSMVIMQQTLHGYRNGHRLLSASFPIPTQSKALLLSLSDMSGPSMVSGFEKYLTGYPISELAMYAFATTWYAPEMQRPGCVWTHTILIRFEDIERFPSIRLAAHHFARPGDANDFEAYSDPILLDPDSEKIGFEIAESLNHEERFSANELRDTLSIDAIGSILFDSDAPVLIGHHDAKSMSLTVLSLWDVQWPDLRARFKFCTGALTPRRLADEEFDLQVIPSKHRSRF
jgi:hypothetical protein